MYAITFVNDTVFTATRLFGLHHPHDEDGAKTTFWAQIDGIKRKLDPKTLKEVTRDWT